MFLTLTPFTFYHCVIVTRVNCWCAIMKPTLANALTTTPNHHHGDMFEAEHVQKAMTRSPISSADLYLDLSAPTSCPCFTSTFLQHASGKTANSLTRLPNYKNVSNGVFSSAKYSTGRGWTALYIDAAVNMWRRHDISISYTPPCH